MSTSALPPLKFPDTNGKPVHHSVSAKPVALPQARPDLDGARLVAPEGGTVWLAIFGELHGFPDAETYNRLINTWEGITPSSDIPNIVHGFYFDQTTCLAVENKSNTAFLITGGVKYRIASEEVFNRYHFNWSRLVSVPQSLLNGIPSGPSISHVG